MIFTKNERIAWLTHRKIELIKLRNECSTCGGYDAYTKIIEELETEIKQVMNSNSEYVDI